MSKELLYQDIEPFKSETIQVSDVHTVYYEVSGNENGQPALFLHGGPGSGCNAWQRGWFNPKRYKIVLIDQRGCGKSTPIGETKENTTQDLINDIELIRDRLGIKNWKIIFGGSWGSTLILAYLNHVLSKDYKGSLESIESVVMYGVFLGRKREIQSTYNASGPGAHLFPEGFEDFMEPINKMSEELKRNDESTVDLYSKIFNNYSNAFSQEEINTAVFRWSQWESRISSGVKTPNDWEKIDVSLREEAEKTKSRAILENYYFVNDCFQNGNIFLEKEFAQLVAGANIRVSILIGRHDLVTPPLTAVSLCKNLKNNHVQCVVENTTGGHTALDRCNTEVLLRWINPEDQVQDTQTPV